MVPFGLSVMPGYHVECDIIIALQIATEVLFTNFFEMAYVPSHKTLLTIRYSLSWHTKRVTLKVEDMRLLRQLWKLIDPFSPLGNDTPENRKQKELVKNLEARKLTFKVVRMRRRVDQLKVVHRGVERLTLGEKAFCRKHQIRFQWAGQQWQCETCPWWT